MEPTNYVPPPTTVHYQYNESYQLKILALLVRYPNFIHKYGEVVRPEFFEVESFTVVSRLILEFYKSYHVIPTYDSLIAWVSDFCSKYHVRVELRESYLQLIVSIFHCDMSDGDAVRDSSVVFAKRQSLKSAVRDIVDLIDKHGGYDKSLDMIQKALLVGQGLGSHGSEVWNSMGTLSARLAENSPYSSARKIPTPFPGLNSVRAGGLGPGECMVIVGSSGQGKSIIKNNCGVVASYAAQGDEWVAHATLELSELDNLLRYASRLTGIDQDQIVLNSPDWQRRIQEVARNNAIYVKWFPPGATTPGHLRSWISALSGEIGCGPCALIVDYPDKMTSSKGSTDSLYIDNGRIYDELITLLHDYSMCGFFSSQFTRGKQYKDDSDSSDMANSIAKLYNSDVVGIIHQTKAEKTNGVGRLWWDKVRRGRDMFYSYYQIDYGRATVREDLQLAEAMQHAGENPSAAPPQTNGAGTAYTNQTQPTTPAMPQYVPAPPPNFSAVV